MRYTSVGIVGVLYKDVDGDWCRAYKNSNGGVGMSKFDYTEFGDAKAIPETHPLFNINMIQILCNRTIVEWFIFNNDLSRALNRREDLQLTLSELLMS